MHYQRWQATGSAGQAGPLRRTGPQTERCTEPGCARVVRCRSLCAKHYAAARLAAKGRCTVEGCERRQHSSGVCSMHWARMRLKGDAGGPDPLVNVGSGRSETTDGYIRILVPGHPTATTQGWALEHRWVAYEAGLLTDLADHVHHQDHDTTNNAITNLEVMTPAEHARLHHPERIPWNDAVVMYEGGATTTEIAKALGTYAGNVSRALRARGVQMRLGHRYGQPSNR